MQTLACLDGELMPADEARVPINDRGFLFGDAVYEVCRIYEGRSWLETEHFDRLGRSLAAMQFLGVDLDLLLDRARRTIEASEVGEGTLYIHITRGVAPRKHAFPGPSVPPTELIVVKSYDDGPTARLRESGSAAISHPDLRWGRCDVKSTNLLANVIACEAAARAGAIEAILHDSENRVTEATHSSVLWVRDGRLSGTPEGPIILPGTTRAWMLRVADDAGIPFAEGRIDLEDLRAADEVILAGTTIEVMPVVRLDGRAIADGTPGPITRRLQSAFRAAVDRWRALQPA